MEAERLLVLTGFSAAQAGSIFGVSRQTYQSWKGGVSPHPDHRAHLLDVIPLIEEAASRLGSTEALGNWLQTPVVAGGSRPIDYLAGRRFDTFRGAVLRLRTGRERIRPVQRLSRGARAGRQSLDHLTDLLTPRPWLGHDPNDGVDEEG
jgi:hypothetical protein